MHYSQIETGIGKKYRQENHFYYFGIYFVGSGFGRGCVLCDAHHSFSTALRRSFFPQFRPPIPLDANQPAFWQIFKGLQRGSWSPFGCEGGRHFAALDNHQYISYFFCIADLIASAAVYCWFGGICPFIKAEDKKVRFDEIGCVPWRI